MDDLTTEFIAAKLVVTGRGQDRIPSAVLVPMYIAWYEERTGYPLPRRSAAVALAAASRSYLAPKTGAQFRSMMSHGPIVYVGVALA